MTTEFEGEVMFYPSSLLAPFTPRAGRVTQAQYLLRFVLPLVVVAGLTWLLFVGAPGLLGTPGYFVASLGWTLLLATGDAHNIRRWHDLGSSAALYRLLRPAMVLLPMLAAALQFLVPAQLAQAGDIESLGYLMSAEFGGMTLQPAPLALLAIACAAGGANVIYLSVMPGQQGPNTYGPDPNGGSIVPGGQPGPVGPASDETDPVKRALADYHARQNAAARPVSLQPGAKPSTTFGKKR